MQEARWWKEDKMKENNGHRDIAQVRAKGRKWSNFTYTSDKNKSGTESAQSIMLSKPMESYHQSNQLGAFGDPNQKHVLDFGHWLRVSRFR